MIALSRALEYARVIASPMRGRRPGLSVRTSSTSSRCRRTEIDHERLRRSGW
jgi:hypothetical protein